VSHSAFVNALIHLAVEEKAGKARLTVARTLVCACVILTRRAD